MPHIGQTVVFVPHVDHPGLSEHEALAAIIGRTHDDGSADLFVLVPNREGLWMDAVPQDSGPFGWMTHEQWTEAQADKDDAKADDASQTQTEQTQTGTDDAKADDAAQTHTDTAGRAVDVGGDAVAPAQVLAPPPVTNPAAPGTNDPHDPHEATDHPAV